MKQVCCLHKLYSYKGKFLSDAIIPYKIDQVLSTDDILFLQDIFLTRGLHHIMVSDVVSGRMLIHKFLESLNCHHEIACFTLNVAPTKQNIFDMYTSLVHCCGYDASYEEVEEFFLEQCFADFMWIENLNDLGQIPLVTHALKVMHDLGMVHDIPTIAVSCAD